MKEVFLLTTTAESFFVRHGYVRRSREEAPDSYLARLEQASMLASMENLRTFPFIRDRCDRGQLALHGAYFDVASGELSAFDQTLQRFVATTPPSAWPG